LGAALIAGAAGGHDLVGLEGVFCKPAADSLLLPDTTLAGKYSTALTDFRKLLEQTING
jgi:hypothetical protein